MTVVAKSSPLDRAAGAALRLARPLASRISRGRLSILIYHRVLDAPDPMRPGDPDVNRFRWQVSLLAREFRVLRLAEAVDRLRAGTLPERALCITFDDGYADNARNALPILREYGVPATFFVATGFLDGGRMWNDTVIEAVRRVPGPELDLDDAGLGRHSLGNDSDRRRAAESIIRRIKHLPPAERGAHADALAQAANSELPDDLMMTSDQVQALAAAGMTIGGHTVTHPILARLERDDALAEIRRGKDFLESLLDREVDLFAYPNGKPGSDFLPPQVSLLEEAGFKAAVTTEPGVSTARTNPYMLRRFTPWDATPARFHLRLLRNCMQAGQGQGAD